MKELRVPMVYPPGPLARGWWLRGAIKFPGRVGFNCLARPGNQAATAYSDMICDTRHHPPSFPADRRDRRSARPPQLQITSDRSKVRYWGRTGLLVGIVQSTRLTHSRRRAYPFLGAERTFIPNRRSLPAQA
jgi:hypothetical protein